MGFMGLKCCSLCWAQAADVVVGLWDDNRIGTFRGLRSGKTDYGGIVFGDKDILRINPTKGYRPLLVKIVEFFQTGKPCNPGGNHRDLCFHGGC